MYLLIFDFFCVLANVIASDLPPYIEKCSLTSNDLSRCLTDSANNAIPHLLKGDKTSGIPSGTPLYLPNTVLDTDNLKIFCEDVYVDGLQTTKLTHGFVDAANNRMGFDADLSKLEVTGKYSITNGTILNRLVSGTGKFNMTVVGIQLQSRSYTRIIERNDEQYIQLYGTSLDLKAKRAYYFFENLKSFRDDINEFIDKNWEILRDDLLPSLKEHMLKIIRLYVPVTSKVPLRKVFLP